MVSESSLDGRRALLKELTIDDSVGQGHMRATEVIKANRLRVAFHGRISTRATRSTGPIESPHTVAGNRRRFLDAIVVIWLLFLRA